MTDLEDRLTDLTTPTSAGSPAASIEHLELAAAARRHRNRSARVLAAAAIVVLVGGLAVAIVRRPQPTVIDTSGTPSTLQPDALLCRADGEADPVPPTQPTASEVCAQVDGHVVSIGFTVAPDASPSDIADAMAIIQQRIATLGDTGATVELVDGMVLVNFDPALHIADSPTVQLLFRDLPGSLGLVVSATSADTQP